MCITFGPLTKSGFDVIRFLMCQLAVRDLPSCPQSFLFKSEWPLGTYKGQIISECPYKKNCFSQNTNEKISEISALASKERSNQKLY